MAAKKQDSKADMAAIGFIIAIALAVVSAGVLAVFFLLRIPLRRCTKGNSGVPLAYIGIITIIAGILIGFYQIIASNSNLRAVDRLTVMPWFIFGAGSVTYLLGLLLVKAYQGRLQTLYDAATEYGRNGNLSSQLIEEMRSEGQRIGVSSSDIDLTIRDVDTLNSLTLIHKGVLPHCDLPQNIFLQEHEDALFFRACVYYEDTNYQMRYTQGNTIYWRASQNLTMAPSQRISKTMTMTEMIQQDHGILLFTSKRVRFHGEKNDFDYWLPGIIGIDEYSNGIQLHYEKKNKRQVFSMDAMSSQLFAETIRKAAEIYRASTLQ